jgi:hypothetical protein
MGIRLEKIEDTGVALAEDVKYRNVSEAVESNTNKAFLWL